MRKIHSFKSIKNYIEVIVDNLLIIILNEYNNICTCKRCIDDIKSIILNNIKPFYFATEKGSTYAKLMNCNHNLSLLL